MFSPFEQFELNIFFFKDFLYLKKIGIDLTLTNLSITLFFVLLLLVIYLVHLNYKTKLIPNNWSTLFELIYKFVLGLIKEQTGLRGLNYFPLILNIFILILCLNLIGLVPFNFTVTAQVAVTFTLALSFFISFIIIGFKEQGISFLKIFVPSGIPNWLLPLLVLIEIMSFFYVH